MCFFLNGVWSVRDEGVRIGFCFTIGRRPFLLTIDFGGYEHSDVTRVLLYCEVSCVVYASLGCCRFFKKDFSKILPSSS